MNKPAPSAPRPLAEVLRKTLGDAFAKKGFASVELVTRWREIVGPEIALHSQPEKIQWPRAPVEREARQPGTLWLKVEGPAAIEIQHLAGVIAERVNQFSEAEYVKDGSRLLGSSVGYDESSARPNSYAIVTPSDQSLFMQYFKVTA